MEKKVFRFKYIHELICAMGGVAKVAERIGVTETAVYNMIQRGINSKYWPKIKQMLPGITSEELGTLEKGRIPVVLQERIFSAFFGPSYLGDLRKRKRRGQGH